jgi:hypothetical protein
MAHVGTANFELSLCPQNIQINLSCHEQGGGHIEFLFHNDRITVARVMNHNAELPSILRYGIEGNNLDLQLQRRLQLGVVLQNANQEIVWLIIDKKNAGKSSFSLILKSHKE